MERALAYDKASNIKNKDKECVLSIDHVYKSFGDHPVLVDFNLKLYKGENVVIFGKSGSGKSVLIKCIIGLLRPDQGTITVLDQDVLSMNHQELDQMSSKV